MAYPRQLSEETINKAHDLIASGWTTVDVIDAIGVSRQSWYRWRNAGEEFYEDEVSEGELDEYDALCLKFYRAINAAEARRKNDLQEAWHAKGREGDWRAAMEYLARHHPEEWAKKTNVDVTSQGEKVDFRIVLSDDDEDGDAA